MKRLSKKEKGFVRAIVQGKNGTEAALANYDVKDENSAAVVASNLLSKVKIEQAIEDALPDELLDEVHREGLKATREYFSPEGELMAGPDFNARAKYLDMAYKRKGTYAPDKSISVNVEAAAPLSEEDKKLLEILKRNDRNTGTETLPTT